MLIKEIRVKTNSLKITRLTILFILICCNYTAFSQAEHHDGYTRQDDLLDIISRYIHRHHPVDTTVKPPKKVIISAVPAAGYTLQTGFAGLLNGNAAFHTNDSANTSTINLSFTYTVRNQTIAPIVTNIWTKDNKYNISGDWRYIKFPSFTYGIGGYTNINDGYLIDYSAIRIHETIMRKVKNNIYLGLGYGIDYFWGIKELTAPAGVATDFQKYGLNSTEIASGITFNFLYDSRKNSINPDGGAFANIIYRPNLAVLGNEKTWRSLVMEGRKYIRFPANSDNILALWTYEWFTVTGKPPYLMLPNTGNDPYSNTGRGYIQGRYRGNNMAYIEGEYRFTVTRNGLIGGVVFANAQSFTELGTNKFETIAPGWGGGLRVKLNKNSRTNIAIDYGFGLGGSQGLFVNLGEVF